MSSPPKKRSKKSGLPPGTLIHIGENSDRPVRITVNEYTADRHSEKVIDSLGESFYYPDEGVVSWIDVEGLHEVQLIRKVGDRQGLHPLVLEDVVNTNQRPKMEDYGDYIYIVLKMIHIGERGSLRIEQISIIVGASFVATFQEGLDGNVFAPIRERLRSGKGRLRSQGADALAHSLVDFIVDSYFAAVETMGEAISDVEETVVLRPTEETMRQIYRLKRRMIELRRAVWPAREVMSALERRESPLIGPEVAVYFRDVYDHTIQVIDTLEAYREMVSGLLDIYLTSLSNRMNEVMKFLTIVGTIFIPLTFIAGVYGMNFQHMPELHWRWGYFAALGLMGLVALVMLLFFRRKRWL
jgi:magnesium transporter